MYKQVDIVGSSLNNIQANSIVSKVNCILVKEKGILPNTGERNQLTIIIIGIIIVIIVGLLIYFLQKRKQND